MRKAIAKLASLGPLPSEEDAIEPDLSQRSDLLLSIQKPVTDDEAEALVRLFGPDGCYGLAWTLVHLIESAPSWPIIESLRGDGEWIQLLRYRARLP
jgi:hypothetical protein